MIFSPVHAGYPGKYVSYAVAAFVVAHLSYAVTHSIRQKRDGRNRTKLGVIEKPDAKKNPRGIIAIVLVDLIILGGIIGDVYNHRPN
jgi:hypothetical protein